MLRRKRDTTQNISCSISFPSIFPVISRKFGLLFGQCMYTVQWSTCPCCDSWNLICRAISCSSFQLILYFPQEAKWSPVMSCAVAAVSGRMATAKLLVRRRNLVQDAAWVGGAVPLLQSLLQLLGRASGAKAATAAWWAGPKANVVASAAEAMTSGRPDPKAERGATKVGGAIAAAANVVQAKDAAAPGGTTLIGQRTLVVRQGRGGGGGHGGGGGLCVVDHVVWPGK